MKKHLIIMGLLWAFPLLLGSLPGLMPTAGKAFAADNNEEKRKTRQVPAMRERTYKALSEAQLMIDPESVPVEEGEKRPEPKGTPQDAIKMLKDLLDRRGLNSYEKAQIWNTLAFGYYTLDDIPKTIDAYENVLKQGEITYALELSTLRALFQLYYSREEYQKSIEYIDRWQALKEDPDPDVTFIKATAYYQMEKYKTSLETALKIDDIAKAQGRKMKENWWYLQVVLYNQLNDIDNQIKILEKLVVNYPKKQYWMQLAAMYSEKDWSDKALSAYYAAYTQGLFTRGTEVVMLAQRLLNAEVPYEAATVLQKGLKDDMVEKDADNYRLLAQSYTMAQEMGKAIDAWRKATEYAEDGQLYLRLAQALSREDRHEEAIKAYRKALDMGGLRDVHDTEFWLGISLMQLERWDEATKVFRKAAEDPDKAKRARQYIQYIANEKKRQEKLQEMIAPAVGQR